MKTYLIISVFVLASFILKAQQYSFTETIEENAWQAVPGNNGTFYTVSWEPGCPTDLIIIRYFGKTGEVVSSFKSPPYTGSFNSINAVTNDLNNIVLYMRLDDINHLIYEFDSTGTVVLNNNLQFVDPVVKFTKITASPTGYYLLGNTYTTSLTDSSHAVITKLSVNGWHKWTKFYRMNNASAASTHFNDMLIENNSLLCVGRYYYTDEVIGQAPLRPVISRLDTAGVLINSYYYMIDSSFIGFTGYEFVQVDKTPSGKYYLVANDFGNEHAIFKLDNQYNIQWVRKKLSGKANAMCAGYNEDLFISPVGEDANFAMQIDSAGTIIGNHITRDPSSGPDFSFDHLTGIQRHNCGFLLNSNQTMIAHTDHDFHNCLDSSVTGYSIYYPVSSFYRRNTSLASGDMTPPNQYGMTMVYTQGLSIPVVYCSDTYSCDDPAGVKVINPEELSIYPIPAKDMINISIPETMGDSKIQFCDINGRCIFEKSCPGGMQQVPCSDLAPGIYILKLISKSVVRTAKIVIG